MSRRHHADGGTAAVGPETTQHPQDKFSARRFTALNLDRDNAARYWDGPISSALKQLSVFRGYYIGRL